MRSRTEGIGREVTNRVEKTEKTTSFSNKRTEEITSRAKRARSRTEDAKRQASYSARTTYPEAD